MMNQILAVAQFFWEVPLGFLSFVFFKSMKFSIGNLYNFRLSKEKQKNLEWQPLCKETLERSITLPFWMTFGPRLNTHAIIATVGPFEVKQSIDLDIRTADNSAESWTIAVYRFPDYKTVTKIVAGQVSSENQWKSLELKPGTYMLGLRYYNWSESVEFPAVKIDGVEVVKYKTVPNSINNFYSEFRQKENWFYLCLHYYLFPLLRLRKWLPKSFVKKEFLPVGDPSLTYYYGVIRKGECINVDVNPLLFNSYDVYMTVYDRCSFAVFFHQIKTENYTSKAMEEDCFYLFRVRQKTGIQEQFVSDWIDIKVLSPEVPQIKVSSYS
ncbi:MAG: DUF6208 family protein [Cyanobacteria bacterium P01_D01_bin.50]